MLRLWGRTSSINVRKVLWTLQELGVPFERIDAGLAYGHNHTPDYLAKNPNALVPMLEDGDFTLWESNAIVRYLCAKYGDPTLYPEDLRQRFDAERWMDWQQTTLNPAGRDAFIQWIRTPAAQRNSALIAASVAATEPLLDMLEQHLSTHPFMAGERFTMADISVGYAVMLARQIGLEDQLTPGMQAYFDRLSQREGFRRAQAAQGGAGLGL